MKQNGKTFYADPDTIHNQVYTGYRVQYQAYKQAQLLASRQNPALNVHPDPHGVVVNEFDGWVPGPLAPIDGIKISSRKHPAAACGIIKPVSNW